jgi:ferritin-like metal-binding protein YciE
MAFEKITTFKELFVAKLQTMYDIEQQLVQALPKMAEAATDPELKQGFQNHLKETQGHVSRLEQIFKSIGVEAETETSDVVRAMISETEWCIKNIEDPNVLDAALISAGQSAEHFEMAVYGTASEWAKLIDLPDVQQIFEQTLAEEKKADETLNQAAMKVNKMALEETMDTETEQGKGFFGLGKKIETGNI